MSFIFHMISHEDDMWFILQMSENPLVDAGISTRGFRPIFHVIDKQCNNKKDNNKHTVHFV